MAVHVMARRAPRASASAPMRSAPPLPGQVVDVESAVRLQRRCGPWKKVPSFRFDAAAPAPSETAAAAFAALAPAEPAGWGRGRRRGPGAAGPSWEVASGDEADVEVEVDDEGVPLAPRVADPVLPEAPAPAAPLLAAAATSVELSAQNLQLHTLHWSSAAAAAAAPGMLPAFAGRSSNGGASAEPAGPLDPFPVSGTTSGLPNRFGVCGPGGARHGDACPRPCQWCGGHRTAA